MNFETYIKELRINYPKFKTEINHLFNLYYPKNDCVSIEQKDAINEIISSANLIKSYIKPLEDMGLNFSFSIVGGAVRDWILNKSNEITDHDFVISLNNSESVLLPLEPEKIKNFFSEAEMLEINQLLKKYNPYTFKPDDNEECKNNICRNYNTFIWPKLFEKIMQMHINNYELFDFKNVQKIREREESYLFVNNQIHSLFKIKNINNKDIDIIISNFNESGFTYIRGFDFELCKASVDLSFINNKNSKSNLVDDFIDNMWLMPGMLRDIHYKTLTITPGKFELEHIKYFMDKHYPKLKKKFPENKLNALIRNSSMHKDSENFLLNYEFGNETTNSDKKRIKI